MAIDKDHHVRPHGALLIEDVAPCPWVSPKDRLERFPYRLRFHPCRRAWDMTLNVRGEGDSHHIKEKRERELPKA